MNRPLPSARMHDSDASYCLPEWALCGLVVLLASFAPFNATAVWNLVSHSILVVDERAQEEPLAKSVQTLASLRRSSTGRLAPPQRLSQVPRVLAFDSFLASGYSAGEHAWRNGIGAPLRC